MTDGPPASASGEFRPGRQALRNARLLGVSPSRLGRLRTNYHQPTGSVNTNASDTEETMTNDDQHDGGAEHSTDDQHDDLDLSNLDPEYIKQAVAEHWVEHFSDVLAERDVSVPDGAIEQAVVAAVDQHVGDAETVEADQEAVIQDVTERLVAEHDGDDGEPVTSNASHAHGDPRAAGSDGPSFTESGRSFEADRPGSAIDSASAPTEENADKVQKDHVAETHGDANVSPRARDGDGYTAYKAAEDTYAGDNFTFERYRRAVQDATGRDPVGPTDGDGSGFVQGGSVARDLAADKQNASTATNYGAVPGSFDRSARIADKQNAEPDDVEPQRFGQGAFCEYMTGDD